ncbi:sigma-70 family RNA polymerase sigma factor [Sphingobacterium faecium]|uniref:sigma-70 family RNA polymerase sigma factor n=1 Tax=Sphingobacterium faecium TaxID=34087 RepID=UPI002468889B|nr:sigma-70 family RNA polymerase sigma factor [Sphingobacterium faecium]MDH5826274.1 sigma-70 family RNA polymerase sigma factor [Sphingobacterium faecium]
MMLDKKIYNKEEIFKEIVHSYYAQLCAFSVQFTDSLVVSEDLVQDVLLSFWEEKKYLLAKESLRSYIFMSVRNASIDYVRKNRLRIFIDLEEANYLAEEEISESELQLQHHYLHQLLDKLPKQERRVLLAIVVENKKYKALAEEMGISVNTIKTHFSRAMKFLRKNNIKIHTFFLFY